MFSKRGQYSDLELRLFVKETSENIDSVDLCTAAMLEDDPTRFQFILKRNIQDVNRQNKSGWTPLMYACQSGNARAVKVLLDHKANERIYNYKGQTAFMVASIFGHEDILQLLNDSHCFLNSIDKKGWSSLMYAITLGHLETAQYLIQNGADVFRFSDGSNGRSILMVAVANIKVCGSLLPLLIGRGADHRVLSEDMKTAADIASELGKEYQDVAEYLRSPFRHHNRGKPPLSLRELLQSIEMEKYFQLFEDKRVYLEEFVTFTEQDLKNIGVKLLGPRKKMAQAIEDFIYGKAMITSTMK